MNGQLHNILLRFNHIFGYFFPSQLLKGVREGRTDGRTEKHNSFYNIDYYIKTSSTGPSGKTKLFINCFRNPTSTCATENWRKPNLGKQPTVDCIVEPIQRSGVKHCVGKFIPHSNLCSHETPWYFKLQWICCDRSSGMSNSSRSRLKLAELTVIRSSN